jgi:plasmid stability protein
MATLYVENIPDRLYEALRKRARLKRKSIAAEVLELLEENIVTEDELKRRRKLFLELKKVRALPSPRTGPFASTEEMVREDRKR